MCGIAGIYFKRTADPADIQRFRECASLIRHRGPDAHGEILSDSVFLSHFRLKILDLTDNANQPFPHGSSRSCIVFNGEIYNFRELADKFGIATQTRSDTEVLYRLFDSKGVDVLAELNGIFAFAHWDSQRRKLTLCRDRFGVKPLYFSETAEYLAFASEAKVLYAFQSEISIDRQVLSEFMWCGSSVGNSTIVKGVKKLPPGHILEISADEPDVKTSQFWSVRRNRQADSVDSSRLTQVRTRTRELLESAVERQCISDVPVGAYLSGGIDSSIVVALAARHLGGRLDTFSVAFKDADHSELELAKMTAQMYGTNHNEVHVSPADIIGSLDDIVFQYDEPFADPAALPLFLLAHQIYGSISVVLQGDGADELFGGYGRHLDLSQKWLRRFMFSIAALVSRNAARRASMRQRSSAIWAWPAWRRMALMVCGPPESYSELVLAQQIAAAEPAPNPFAYYKDIYDSVRSADSLQEMLLTDMQIILPNTFLEKVDKVSMLHAIEARVPYLDNDLAEFVMALPSGAKVSGGKTKTLLRAACGDLIPPEVLHAKKVSFGTPMGEWLRGDLYDFARDTIANARENCEDILDIGLLQRLLREHRDKAANHSGVLWRSIVLIRWLDIYRAKYGMKVNVQ